MNKDNEGYLAYREKEKIRGQKYRNENRDTVRKNNIIRHNKRVEKIRSFVNRYKLLVGCSGLNCHYNKIDKPFIPEILHFDHKDRSKKVKAVSVMIKSNYSIKDIKTEIRKCQVLCANCHIEKSMKHKDYKHKINQQ